MQCKCKGSKEVKVNTGTGCAKGGFPDCPTPGELYCKDGTKLDPSATMLYRSSVFFPNRVDILYGGLCPKTTTK